MKRLITMLSLLSALVVAPLAGAQSTGTLSQVLNTQSCGAAFNQSAASRSCRLKNAQDFANNYCQISAECTRGNGSVAHPIYQGNKGNVPRLQNCDGQLRVGGC